MPSTIEPPGTERDTTMLHRIPILGKLFLPERNGTTVKRSTESERALLEIASLSSEAVLAKFASCDGGLDAAKVEEVRARVGPNEAVRERRLGFLGEIFERFKNPLVLQLLVIAVVSYLMDDVRAATVVGAMIVLSVFLSYIQEMRSSKAAEKLRAMIKTTCTAVRAGKEADVPMRDLVPGDVLVLAAGSIIPADLRLLVSKDFYVSQSALTGEAMPVEKHARPCDAAGKAALDLPNAAFQGSTVLSGTARAIVVTTGENTYFGAISEKLAGQRVQTSFDKGINAFTWLMIRFMVVMVSAVFLIIGLTKHGGEHPWSEALVFALSVAVGLTPEMLPMIVTVNLAKGALSMSRKKAIVKRLNSIQNFGAMDILSPPRPLTHS